MTTDREQSSLRHRLEVGRLLIGSVLELGIKAYGAGAAASVALSDAETVGGKAQDAVAAVPNLMERYRAAKYVVDHRQEIQSALDYVNGHTLPQAELEATLERSSVTLRDIQTTNDQVVAAKEAADEALDVGVDLNPFNGYDGIDGIDIGKTQEAFGHVRAAWAAKPDLESIRDLADAAEQVSPYVDQVEVLVPVYYGNVLNVADNFASDEIAATLGVMALALGIAFVLGTAVGFWVRRGRPGLVARTLQRWGARTFRRWYVRNLPHALSPALYSAAHERIQRDIVADPQDALSPEAFRELERWFAGRGRDTPAP
ncbi:hypothetical protein SAMN05192575_1011078 [Nocardioides alpinus]|uniref:Uncharacterized protein n=1 Tax=Nocardioides alpinus TaxID=748909 RepID=A0A1I0WMR6_9ACTN|nr:hypothetical protein [Nocardioides alpinus]PKH37988.1 hypothetical protein CXG46_21700 [Nocardioides alpinus]SFA89293.1 hypothetical protein SAMN05192575_1011078 [Nocardioides alpinus]